MTITNLAIKYRTSIVVLTIILVIGGLLSYLTIPKEAQPSIEIPNIVVTTIYPGASPDDIESLLTQPIEQEIQAVNGIKEIRSISTEGVSTVIVEFDPDVSMDDAFQKVRDKVDVAKAELPEEVEEPIVSEIDVSEFPILTLNLAGDYSVARLKEVAEELEDELEAIPSVLEVDLIGGLEREVQVNVDLSALQGYNLTFNDVIATIQQENVNLPGGSVDVDRLNYLVRVDGEFEDPAEIENLVIEAPGGNPIYVRDVAEVIFGFKERESYARLRVFQEDTEDDELRVVPASESQTLQVVSLNVKKRSGDNILETVEQVKATLAAFPLPPGTQVVVTGDQSKFVETMVEDLENNIISGLIFVVAVLLFFLGVRNALLVGIAIPLSMFVSFIVFQTLGYTLNFIILFSLIIALGMLVDNAIVIVENIFRFREEGHSRFEAARLGTQEVGGAVVASTATTVAAFAPMLFWPGIIGEFMSFMPLTLIVTLTCSLFVAIIINPVITGIFVKLESEESRPLRKAARLTGAVVIGVLGVVLAFANYKTLVVLLVGGALLYLLHTRLLKPVGTRFVETGLPRIIARYRDFLHWMLERDYTDRSPVLARKGAVGLGVGLLVVGGMALGMMMSPEAPVSGEAPLGQAIMGGGLLLAVAGVVRLLTAITNTLFRNVFALGSLTLGLVLMAAGGGVQAAAGQAAGAILLTPGGLLLLAGLIGILLHAAETIYLGGSTSVRSGLIFGAVTAAILGLMILGPRDVEFVTVLELLILPGLIVAIGLLGVVLNRSGRTRLFLSDNRARLLNSTLAGFIAILGMFAAAPTGVEFFPETDPNLVNVTLDGPLGMNIEASDELAQTGYERVLSLLDADADARANVKNVLVNVGVGGDAAFGGGAASPERSRITLNMVDYIDRAESSRETLMDLRTELQGIPGAEIEFSQDQAGPPTGAPVNIEIAGEDFDRIVPIAKEIKRRLTEASETGAIPGLVDVADNLNTGRPELKVNIDRERAARFGLNTNMIATTVRAAINGIEAGQYRTGEDEYDITVRLDEVDRADLASLRNLTIKYEGQQIPIASVADFEVSGGLGSVTRLDLSRVATVTADAAPGYNGQAVLQQVQAYLSDYEETLPTGYAIEYTGENEEQQESFGFLFTALLIGVALIFMIMVAQFNSVSAPFIIMVAVGFSFIGVMLGLMLTRTPFGLMTFIGLISLAGIVVNNNIVLIDYMMQLRARGMEKQAAIIEAGATRLRPVLLTALTTVLGLIPLTFGINMDFVGLLADWDPNFQIGSENTQFWGPMGTAIISGLVFGTFLTLVIVPVMYSAFDSAGLRLSRVFSRGPAEDTLDPATGNGRTTDAPYTPPAVPPAGDSGLGEPQPELTDEPR